MRLTREQKAALQRLVDAGFERTTAALSELVDKRIRLAGPEIVVCPLPELYPRLTAMLPGEVVTVHQIFGGAVAGDAMLLLEFDSASTLVRLLTGSTPLPGRLSQTDQDALVEVGNILLNAFVGTISNLLQLRVIFTIPYLRLEAVDTLLDTLMVGQEELRYALLVSTRFWLEDDNVDGCLVLVLGVSSLEGLLRHIHDEE